MNQEQQLQEWLQIHSCKDGCPLAREHSEMGSASYGTKDKRTKGPGESGGGSRLPPLPSGPRLKLGGGCHLPPVVFPPPTHPKPWKSQKNSEERPWIYLPSSFLQKLEANVAFMVTTWMPRPPGSYYQLCLPIQQFAKCHN